MTISSKYMAMADAEVLASVQSPFVGMTDPRIASLRCFKFYSRESGSFLTSPEGIERWFGPKAAKVYAIAHRDAGTHTTMKAIAAEAMCCVSTVSRALTRLQAFGFLAVDVKRGRNGGITVRLRRVGDALKHYAAAAWEKLKKRVLSAPIKVASVFSLSGEVDLTSEVPTWVKDATFMEAWDDAERRGAELSRDARRADAAIVALGQDGAGSAPSADRIREWVRGVLHERVRLDQEAPDWDFELDKARERWLK